MQDYEGIELDDRYLLRRAVDAGNFGAVYEAIDKKFDSRVAVKVLFESQVDSPAFRSEARLARQFRHPNVVEVYEFGVDDAHKVAYIVMEFLEGLRVDQLIAEPDFDPGTFCRFVDQVGSALDNAHSRNLVHRDFKPQNVMLVDRGRSTERFVLLDLGVASKTDSRTTLRNKALDGALSPQYASPEQVEGRDVDYRSDIYSFGTVLFEWLTGNPPFSSDQLIGLAHAISQQEPPHPSEMTEREIDPEVETVVLSCLHKNPERRPQSIGEVRRRILERMSPETLLRTSAPGQQTGGGPSAADLPTAGPAARTLEPPGDSEELATLRPRSPATQRERDIPTWQPDGRSHAPTGRRNTTVLIAGTLGLGALMVLTAFLWPSEPREQLAVHLPADIEIAAGGETTMVLSISGRKSPDALLAVDISHAPGWLQVETPNAPVHSDSVTLTLRAALQPASEAGTLELVVSDGTSQKQASVRVTSTPPQIWMPAGFTADGDELVASASHQVALYRRIARRVADQPVAFLLVDEPGVPPFYIMQDKTWNALLLRFASAQPKALPPVADRTGWRQGGMARSEPLGIEGETCARLPVMNLNAFEAHTLATWLGGATAHLPTVTQWDAASGFRAWQTGRLTNTDWAEGPCRKTDGQPEVAIGLLDFGPRAVGTSRDDVGPWGCRDMAGNGEELTSSLANQGRVPDCQPDDWVITRSWSYQQRQPLTWQVLDARSRQPVPDGILASDRQPTVGFRIAIDILPEAGESH